LITGVYKVQTEGAEPEKPTTRFGQNTHFCKWDEERYFECNLDNGEGKPDDDGSYPITAHDGDTA
jgi:hypothetical protein